MNILSLRSIFFLIASLLCSVLILAEDVIINAETICYDRKNGKVYAEQNVKVKYKDMLLETEILVYDTEQNKIYTSTDSFLIYHNNRLLAKGLLYDINTESFIISDFYGYYDPYYCYSSTCTGRKDEQLLTNAKVTHCGLKKPHYYLRSKKVLIKPNDRIKLYSPSLVVRSLPVIWLPYYEVSLKPSKDYFVLDPSYENERGLMLKVRYGRRVSDNTDVTLLTDTSFNKHIGLGLEFKYRFDRHNGVVYLYTVKEHQKNTTQWNFRVNNTHDLGKNWSAKSNVEFISNEQLYYFYEKENWFFVRREVNSAVSLSRDVQRYTFRLAYLRNDKYDNTTDRFVNTYYKLPVDFIVQPFSLKQLKISNSFKFVPTLIEATTYYNFTAENNLSVMYPFKFMPQVTFSPTTMLRTIFEAAPNLPTANDEQHVFYNIYYLGFPVRFVVGRRGSLDLTYNYGVRSLNNSIEVSTNIVSNNLSLRADFYYKRTFTRVSTSYDFLPKNVKSWYDRFQPVMFTAGIWYRNLGITSNISYNVSENIVRNFQLGTEYIFSSLNYVSLNYSRDVYYPNVHSVSPAINIYVPENLQARIRSSLVITKDKIDVLNSMLEFYKDLHCWEAKLFCNVRKSLSAETYIYELGGFISLKFKPYVGTGGKISEVDKRYFPWRE